MKDLFHQGKAHFSFIKIQKQGARGVTPKRAQRPVAT